MGAVAAVEQIAVDIVIPVKDRATVLCCIDSLLSQMRLVKGFKVGRILLCEGGSSQQNCLEQLREVARLPGVEILNCAHEGFNKGWLLNQGIQAATAPIVLISDVDIVWNAAALNELCKAAYSSTHFYYVQHVQESEVNTAAVERSRYAYKIVQTPSTPIVEIYNAPADSAYRPGYGLICLQKDLLRKVGGYRHCFRGWGWEDQDLLMRAQLLGYAVEARAQVMHLSHGDTDRNRFDGWRAPQESRDRNILLCLNELATGRLLGDLAPPSSAAHARVCIRCPDTLNFKG